MASRSHVLSLSLALGSFLAACGPRLGGASRSPESPASPADPTRSPGPTGTPGITGDDVARAVLCRPPATVALLPPLRETENPQVNQARFSELQESLRTACASCHEAPAAQKGNFSFLLAYKGEERPAGGEVKFYPGIFESAERIRDAVAAGRMPPWPPGRPRPTAHDDLAKRLDAWIAAGKPAGDFAMATADASPPQSGGGALAPRPQESDLGECIPTREVVGHDPDTDARFAALDATLPSNLDETDLVTLDSLELARRGTFSYNVEYPLWADNAEKGRYVHVPSVKDTSTGAWTRDSIRFDPTTRAFRIPDNTRFYKTFYRAVTRRDGQVAFRKIETRLILVRHPPRKPLFGVYRWNETETEARLVTEPYRDGTPWKDVVFSTVVDETHGTTRPYAIPGRERCVECHKGDSSFVVGFTPLQINRRGFGEGGRDLPVGEDELSQVNRLLSYEVISGFRESSELPRLEATGEAGAPPRNDHELRLQGYFVGNCAHCHTPEGFAMKDNEVKLDLRAGKLFGFNTFQASKDFPGKRFVSAAGDVDRSYLYERVSKTQEELGLFNPMPLNTPGGANCRLLNLTGKWIKSFESPEAAAAFQVDCSETNEFSWLEQDFTWPQGETYIPRRNDWSDPHAGMPERFRALTESPGLAEISRRRYPVGYWTAKETCSFPEAPEPAAPEDWMFKLDRSTLKPVEPRQPKYPFGQLYSTRPGAWFYRTTCQKCHGTLGDGNSAFAKSLRELSGGDIRVANFMDGMFGDGGNALRTFDVPDAQAPGGVRNLAGNYLIWMAMEGTRVKFPPQAEPYVGKHGARMLNLLREKCREHIPTAGARSFPYFEDYRMFRDVCLTDNLPADTPEIQFDPNTDLPVNAAAQDAWLDKGAINAGWMIFDYLKEDAARGQWTTAASECEKVHPVVAPTAAP